MKEFGFFLKTYKSDFKHTKRLIRSFLKFNIDSIDLVIMTEKCDYDLFKQFESQKIQVIDTSKLQKHLIKGKSVNGIREGYFNQQILKLVFWELGIFKNYFVLDSDALFISKFRLNDFLNEDNIPFTILTNDNDLKSDPHYYKNWLGRDKKLKLIKEFLNLTGDHYRTIHNMAIFSSLVLEKFSAYLKSSKLSYEDILNISPYEFSWYNFFLQKNQCIPIICKDPIFKTYHHLNQYFNDVNYGIKLTDLKRGYIGICINSNLISSGKPIKYGQIDINTSFKYILNELKKIIYLLIIRLKNKMKINEKN